MRIVRIAVEHFRAIRALTYFPSAKNALLGPNNIGKTAILEALNLLLTPHGSSRTALVDENDFFRREYVRQGDGMQPTIRVEAVISGLNDEDAEKFDGAVVPWRESARNVIETSDAGVDPFADAERAIRPSFEAWYDEAEDAFEWLAFHRTDQLLPRDLCPRFTREQRRHIGFLIYRDFRALLLSPAVATTSAKRSGSSGSTVSKRAHSAAGVMA